MRLETIAVQAGGHPDPETGAIAPPIHLSTTFEHGPAGELDRGFGYIREGNPTGARLEEALAAIEGGRAALVFASGMAAGVAYLQTLPPGSHVIYPSDLYYGCRVVFEEFAPRWGVASTSVDMTDLEAVTTALRDETRLLWAESPSNPLMKISDLSALARVARNAKAQLIVDGTFATPALQNPIALGAHCVLHSTTKYLGGHSDVQGGALVFAEDDDHFEAVQHIRHILGAVAGPFNSWLILRGLRSLCCRMERHSANAASVALALASHSRVEVVHYPGLSSHPGHEIAARQMRGFGGMLSIQLVGGLEAAIGVASRVKLFTKATSLGGTESLIEHRASSEGPQSTAPQNLLRLSVGLEHPDDLIEDLQQALEG